MISQGTVFHGPHACAMCRKRKRKCDRRLPRCSLCASSDDRECDYTDPVQPPTSESSSRSSPLSDSFKPQPNQFPAVYFLDQDIYHQGMMAISNPAIQISPQILRLLGDDEEVRATASRFFESVHSYMPIVSKKLFFDRLINPLSAPRADAALLCLCMKLMCGPISQHEAQPHTDVYVAAKHYLVELEMAGVLTTQILQSGLLIALYESGHAIYPSAYLSISTCVAYAYAMNLQRGNEFSMSSQFTWVEQEERRRVWWAIVILERIGNLGWPGRHLATPDPSYYDLLPVDDEAWNKGSFVESHPINLSTTLDTNLGRFARLALATHLLSVVVRHVSEKDEMGTELTPEVKQLNRTINALIVLCNLESKRRSMRYCNPVDMCNSALLMLHSRYLDFETTSLSNAGQIYHWAMAKEVMEAIFKGSQAILSAGSIVLDEVSPMALHSTYRVAGLYIRMNHMSPSKHSVLALEILKDALRLKNRKWGLAGAYLRILEAQQVMNSF